MRDRRVKEVEDGLKSTRIAAKRSAIRLADDLLKNGISSTEVATILRRVLDQDDEYMVVKSDVQAVLSAEAIRQKKTSTPDYILRVSCCDPTCSHVTEFDKREICGASGQIWRGKNDVLLLRCESCGTSIEVKVDCEGYR